MIWEEPDISRQVFFAFWCLYTEKNKRMLCSSPGSFQVSLPSQACDWQSGSGTGSTL